MPFSPLSFLLGWLLGPLSVAGICFSGYVLWEWVRGTQTNANSLAISENSLAAGIASGSGAIALWLIVACAVWILWSLFGRLAVLALFPKGQNEPRSERRGTLSELRARDGARLHVEIEGPENAPVLLMTHGWGLDSTAWYYLRQHLSSRFRLVMWDLPGLGRSSRPPNNDLSVEHLASYLHQVMTYVGRPVVLLGHSIGGMTIFTLCRRYPALMNAQVRGIVLVDTTYTQPLNTIIAGGFLKLIDRPIIRPLLHLTVWIAPLVWFWNFLSYLNGSSHLMNRFTSFSRGVTRGQLEFGAWFTVKDNPAVLARGLLAVLHWDETETLPTLRLPVGIIAGSDDRITLPRASEEMLRRIPSAKLTTIAPAGHAGLLEQGGQYSEAIADWVQRAIPTAQSQPWSDNPPGATLSEPSITARPSIH